MNDDPKLPLSVKEIGSSEFMVGARSAPTINSTFKIVYLYLLILFAPKSQKSQEIIEESDGIVISIVTLWEIAIKLSIKKLDLRFGFQELSGFLDELEIRVLMLSFEDTNTYLSLPLHHRDPFDRILIA